MFEEFGPENPPLPPAGALEQAMNRGRKIRRQRRVSVVSAVALSTALVGGFALINPLRSDKAFTPPAVQPTSAPPDYAAIPLSLPSAPQAEKGLDFGRLTSITVAPDGIITLHVNREKFYTGADAEAAAKRNNETLISDFYEEDIDGDQILSFTLDPKASVQATGSLSRNGEQAEDITKPETLTVADLISRFKKLNLPAVPDPDTDASPRVWLRHFNGDDGPVTAIVDQFLV